MGCRDASCEAPRAIRGHRPGRRERGVGCGTCKPGILDASTACEDAIVVSREEYAQRTVAQLTDLVLGQSMSMDRLLAYVMRDEFSPTKCETEPAVSRSESPAAVGLTSESQLTEAEIRSLLRSLVVADREDGVVGAVEEFWVPSVHVRADLVVIGRDLHAFEIKSDADTLKRLPRQVAGFSSLFDRCSIVLAPRHLAKAVEQVPEWWGIAVAARERLDWQRHPEPNPSVEVERVVRLLWRDEVLSLLQGAGITPDLIGGRAGMWRQALTSLDPAAIRDGVRKALASRGAWHEEDGKSRFTAMPAPAR